MTMNNANGSVLHFFAEGNTARGAVHLFDSSLQELNRLYILKGGPGTGKSTLIRTIGSKFIEKGYDAWFIHCARDEESLDGVIIPQLNVGIVDGTEPHIIEPRMPGAVEEYVNLSTAWDRGVLQARKSEIKRFNDVIRQFYDQAYAGFAEALRVHDDWEAIYINNMDFDAANRLTEQYIDKLFGDHKRARTSRIDRRFLGAATPKGAIDYVPNLTADVSKRYLIKGRPGSGKSTMLKQLAAVAQERGFDVEIYHCGFDPNSVDMVIVRELGFAVFDSTSPHEYFPERDNDEIIDMYASCIRPGTDEQYADQLEDIRTRYAAAMKQSIELLAKAKTVHKELEDIYTEAMDFRIVDQLRVRIEEDIEELSRI